MMPWNRLIVFLTILLISFSMSTAFAAEIQELKLEKIYKNELVDKIANLIDSNYVFPALGNKMAAEIKNKLGNGYYSSIKDPTEFAKALTADLRSVCDDKHLWVEYKLEWLLEEIKISQSSGEEKKKLEEAWIEEARKTNFGFKQIDILEGNIGYLQITDFGNNSYATRIVTAAMNFLANSDAVIIDLRKNGGGYGYTVAFLASYFFDKSAGSVHLEDIYTRPGNDTESLWTLNVPGESLHEKELYILTSDRTFSAAESFAYMMKNLKRAVIIGESTKGGAHPTNDYLLMDDFTLTIPVSRSISPITKTDWEGVGVQPDIKTSQEEALATAHILALETLKKSGKGDLTNYDELIKKLKEDHK